MKSRLHYSRQLERAVRDKPMLHGIAKLLVSVRNNVYIHQVLFGWMLLRWTALQLMFCEAHYSPSRCIRCVMYSCVRRGRGASCNSLHHTLGQWLSNRGPGTPNPRGPWGGFQGVMTAKGKGVRTASRPV